MSDESTPESPESSGLSKINVVLCWHMHQPQYCDRPNGEYQLPWTYLHAIKDYTDMAAHLEAEPRARAVVNFAPTLLEQLDDYAKQVTAFLTDGHLIRDPFLAALANPILPADANERLELVGHCLRANERTLIDRYVPFVRLAEMARWFVAHPESALYIGEQFLIDLLMWYHIAWLGEAVRREDPRVQALMEKADDFNLHDRRVLMEIIGELLSGVIGRYLRLAEQGRVELSVTPYAHPIAPLLLDLTSAREAIPDVSLPLLEKYPGGEERLRWHVREGIKTFKHYFGFQPTGCWPAEGSVSTASMPYYEEAGFRWIASGENVLRNSLAQAESDAPGKENNVLHQAYRVDGTDIVCFFRDDGLSDLIGFNYSDWHSDDAVGNLLEHMSNIADACEDQPGAVVSIILDGENAWEYYPENAYYFLTALYRGLADHPRINLTTYAEILQEKPPATNLPRLVAGSWVYGTFSTWIGDADKNRAWDMLGDAKRRFDQVITTERLNDEQRQAAERQLAICEGSDWFWWFGDYNPAGAVKDFDRLFRSQLSALYLLLGEELPEYLSHVFAHGGGQPQTGGVMRRGSDH